MYELDPRARERILRLLRKELGREIDYDDFRSEFENAFNFGLDKKSVAPQEFEAFKRLFDKIVWYSPFPDERKTIPNYIGEKEMEAAVAQARHELGIRIGEEE